MSNPWHISRWSSSIFLPNWRNLLQETAKSGMARLRSSNISGKDVFEMKCALRSNILIHYVCNAHFHWLWRRKFAALKSLRLCHESRDDVTSLATRRSNITKTFWKCVLSDWIRMVITRFVFEWFAGINWIILQSQIPVLPLRWRVAVKLNLRP